MLFITLRNGVVNYRMAVKKNLDHMGTRAEEWVAVEIVGTDTSEDEQGRDVDMPVFQFPRNYSSAPALYAGECCHLCGTNIKRVFWIQNDCRRWIMPVGSECVTHFSDGDSGQRLMKVAAWEQNAELLGRLTQARSELWSRYSKRRSLGYGRYETRIWPHSQVEKEAASLLAGIRDCLGNTSMDSGKAAISRWANRHRDTARQLLTDWELHRN